MKITRALLLSSKKQAEAWECPRVGSNIFGQPLYETQYRYVVTKIGSSLRLQIFRVSQKEHEGRKYNVLADEPHVEEVFEDMDGLTRFLCENNIAAEDGWQPAED